MTCSKCFCPIMLVAWPWSQVFGVRWCGKGRHEVDERGNPTSDKDMLE